MVPRNSISLVKFSSFTRLCILAVSVQQTPSQPVHFKTFHFMYRAVWAPYQQEQTEAHVSFWGGSFFFPVLSGNPCFKATDIIRNGLRAGSSDTHKIPPSGSKTMNYTDNNHGTLGISTWPHQQGVHIDETGFSVRAVVCEIWELSALLGEGVVAYLAINRYKMGQ